MHFQRKPVPVLGSRLFVARYSPNRTKWSVCVADGRKANMVLRGLEQETVALNLAQSLAYLDRPGRSPLRGGQKGLLLDFLKSLFTKYDWDLQIVRPDLNDHMRLVVARALAREHSPLFTREDLLPFRSSPAPTFWQVPKAAP